jgi:hypothetical protein
MRLRLDVFDWLCLLATGVLVTLAAGLLFGLAGCMPQTDLAPDDGASGAGAGQGTAAGTLVDPIAGASDVPVNLAAITVRFATGVTWPPGALRVCGDIAAGDALATPCEAGVCYSAPLASRLPPSASCAVELGPGAVDDGGQPVPMGVLGVFDTAAAADETPPAISAVTLQASGPCVVVTFATDEIASGSLVLEVGGASSVVAAGAGQTNFEVAVPFASLPAEATATVTVRAVDRSGNVAESSPLALQTPASVPPIVITEVLANAVGAEPAQEYVELRNLGDAPLSLEGLSLGDSRGADALPAEVLGAGAYALVVTSAYEAQGGMDVPPRAGTLLLRIDARLGTDGLSNSGEVVRLLQGDALVSSYGGWVNVSSTAWAGHGVHRLVQSACDRATAWNRAPLEATPGWGPP